MIGLHISVSPDGKIKRHLSTTNGEVPLADVNIFDELMALIDKDVWQICVFIKEVLIDTFGCHTYEEGADYLRKAAAQYLFEHRVTDPVYALLTELMITDRIRNRKNKHTVIDQIVVSLRSPFSAQVLVMDILDALCTNTPVQDIPEYPMIQQFTTSAVRTLEETVTVEYILRSYEQYYCFLLQQFIASRPNVAKCQYCGGYFLPKTRRKTLYCDRVIRDGKTCKQIAPAENHKKRSAANAVISVFEQSMNRMRRRLERSGEDKKESPIDINDEQFCLWQNKAVNAKNRYLAGELTEEEAIELIYVPRKDELSENISAELTLETAAP